MRRFVVLVLVVLASIAAAPSAQAARSTDTFLWIAEVPNIGTAANGDFVEVTVDEDSTFDASPRAVSATGTFTHRDAEGNVLGGGTWTATSLISFNFYGCRFIPALDVDLGDDDLCGGAVQMAVTLHTPMGEFPAMLTVFCIIGPMAPANHNGSMDGEGVTLNVPGVINFSHTGGGENVFVRI
jgi:hypothetical protein